MDSNSLYIYSLVCLINFTLLILVDSHELKCWALGSATHFSYANINFTHDLALPRQTPWETECFDLKNSTRENQVFCLPSWMVLGAGKSGTSSLWNYLCNDEQTHRCQEKEFSKIAPSQENIKKMGHTPGFASGNVFMNLPDDLKNYLFNSSCVKFIYILRDPIDYIFSAWHFWCNHRDENCKLGHWVQYTPSAIPRTPANFHQEMINFCIPKLFLNASGNPLSQLPEVELARNRFLSGCTLIWPWNYWHEAVALKARLGDRLFVLRMEALGEDPEHEMHRLRTFLGLPKQSLDQIANYHQVYNYGTNPGIKSVQTATNEPMPRMLHESFNLLVAFLDYDRQLEYFSTILSLPNDPKWHYLPTKVRDLDQQVKSLKDSIKY